jgi:uncharacterized membrane protein
MMSRWGRLALIFSLGLNAFLLAFAATLMWSAHERALHPAAPVLRRAALSLDSPHRAAFVAVLRADGRQSRPETQEARALRRQVWTAFQAQGFDPAAAKAALARGRALNMASRARVEDSLVDFAAGLPADQRAALGRTLERLMPRPKAMAMATRSGPPASPGPGPSEGPRSPP